MCLIGDVVHATTPNLGQGTFQSIKDAYAIGQLLDKGLSIENTFHYYELNRKK